VHYWAGKVFDSPVPRLVGRKFANVPERHHWGGVDRSRRRVRGRAVGDASACYRSVRGSKAVGRIRHVVSVSVNGRPMLGAVYSCCMGATRTQVYLTDDQRRMIDEIAQAEGVTLAEVVRRALDAYLRAERDAAEALASTFGADPDAAMPSRDEWDRG
jgi:hypothetical protein